MGRQTTPMSPATIEKIVKRYNEGVNDTNLCKEFSIGLDRLRRILKEAKVPKRKVVPKAALPDGYKKAPEYLVVNDDEDLEPIKLYLPPCPPIESIDGYGLRPTEQYFRRTIVPKKIKDLKGSPDEKIEILRSNREYYKEEIAWIQREWDRRRNGYWFYNNGVPTYITGVHYFYLNYWFIGSNHPEYRSRDTKFYLFAIMCLLDEYCAGFNYPKFRREGATSKVSCFMYWLTSMERNKHSGIQSQDEPSAEEVFVRHIVHSHRKMPFWFAPVTSGRQDAKSALNFEPPTKAVGQEGRISDVKDSLESIIDFGSQGEGYYDRAKLRMHYSDECGKTIRANVYTRYLRVKPAISEGNKFIGIEITTSTVGEMTKGGGENYKRLCSHSMYHKREDNGETITGLYNLFIPASDGFDLVDKATGKRFIDKHGNSDIKATEKYLSARREALLQAGDMEGYAEEVRQFPMKFKECFRSASGACKFNVEIIESVLDKYRFGNDDKVRGNFQWKDGVKDSVVEWVPSSNGRFYVSHIPTLNNRSVMVGGVKCPAMKHLFIAGGDPFKYNVTKGKASEISDGAGAVYRKFDLSIDDPNADPSTWKSDKFCCTYRHRPRTKDLYGEDMLMMCIFYGCEMFPEINVDFLWDYFERRGYGGYLYYRTDMKTKRRSKTPGATTSTLIQDSIYSEFASYIERRGRYEVHDEILYECREIQDDMNPWDLFVACGYALMGARKQEIIPQEKVVLPVYHRKFKYPTR